MKGTTIRNILVILKLSIIFVVFLFISKTFCYTTYKYCCYNLTTFSMALLTFIYCYHSNYIDFRSNTKASKIIKKVNSLGMKECSDFPVYYLNEEYKNYLFNLLDKISDEQKEIFIKKGYIIVIGTPKELLNITRLKKINGVFSHYEKYILLYIDEKTTKENFESTFYHEWGHFVDYSNYYPSNTLKFKAIFFGEKQKFNSSIRFLYSNNLPYYLKRNPHVNMYELTSASEYFAVNYSKYKRQTLKDKRLIDIFSKIESRD